MTDESLPKIGKSFGGRDHSTVKHACAKIAEEIKKDSEFAEEIRSLKNNIE